MSSDGFGNSLPKKKNHTLGHLDDKNVACTSDGSGHPEKNERHIVCCKPEARSTSLVK